MSKEDFKYFAKMHPELIDIVNNKKMTWQDLYEVYDIYGENNKIWNTYINKNDTNNSFNNTFKDFFDYFKKIDVESVQNGINNIQKTISLLQNIGESKDKDKHEVLPLYKKFDD